MYDLVIVGGGFAGIYSAWNLAKAGLKIAIVDQASGLGGTMRSQEKLGYLVDIGTHNLDLRTIRDAEFYEDILGSNLSVLDDYEWGSTLLKAHTMGLEGPDFSQTNSALCRKALSEIIAADPDLSQATGYLDFVRMKYGQTLFDLLKPMIEKFIGSKADTLDANAAKSLSPFSRVKLGSDSEMAALKGKSRRLDDALSVTLSHPDPRFQGKSVVKRYGYPAHGALLGFCNAVEARLRTLGVDLFLSHQVTALEATAGGAVVTADEAALKGRQVLWTLPDVGLARLLQLDLDLTSTFVPVGVAIHIFEVMQEEIVGPAYLHDFAPEHICFRYARQGCYSNQVTAEGKTFVIAEIPCHPKDNARYAELKDEAWKDLIDVSFLSPHAHLYRHEVIQHPVAYTLPINGWEKTVSRANAQFATRLNNIIRIPYGHRGRDSFMQHFKTSLEPNFICAN